MFLFLVFLPIFYFGYVQQAAGNQSFSVQFLHCRAVINYFARLETSDKQKRAEEVRIGEIVREKARTFTGRVCQAGAGGGKALHSPRLPAEYS